MEKAKRYEKVYYHEGDTVRLRNLPNSPAMLVDKVKFVGRGDDARVLDGIKCKWFDSEGNLCNEKWNDKDLEIVKRR